MSRSGKATSNGKILGISVLGGLIAIALVIGIWYLWSTGFFNNIMYRLFG